MNQLRMPAWIIAGLLALLFLSSMNRRNEFRTSTSNKSNTGDSQPFYEQWIRRHEAYPYECWTDSGYDPSKSLFSRDVQLLAVTDYGKSDIDNGGFHQFFSNGTGVFAPEMLEWFRRNEMSDVARILDKAMRFFGEDYPRDRSKRIARLTAFRPGDGKYRDPFNQLDDEFYAALSNNGHRYHKAANHWLRSICKVNSIDDLEVGRTKH